MVRWGATCFPSLTLGLTLGSLFRSVAILGIILYVIYCTYCRLVEDAAEDRAPKECWGPSPMWRSEYSIVKKGSDDDTCRVCLSAACGEVHFVGCGHAVVCLTCSGLLRSCPGCGENIGGIRVDESLL